MKEKMTFFDAMIMTRLPLFGNFRCERDQLYASVHQDKIELFVYASDKKAKKMIAFLNKQCLHQPWNQSVPKLLKRLRKDGIRAEPDMRFSGVTYDEGFVKNYLYNLFGAVRVVEQNRMEMEWEQSETAV